MKFKFFLLFLINFLNNNCAEQFVADHAKLKLYDLIKNLRFDEAINYINNNFEIDFNNGSGSGYTLLDKFLHDFNTFEKFFSCKDKKNCDKAMKIINLLIDRSTFGDSLKTYKSLKINVPLVLYDLSSNSYFSFKKLIEICKLIKQKLKSDIINSYILRTPNSIDEIDFLTKEIRSTIADYIIKESDIPKNLYLELCEDNYFESLDIKLSMRLAETENEIINTNPAFNNRSQLIKQKKKKTNCHIL